MTTHILTHETSPICGVLEIYNAFGEKLSVHNLTSKALEYVFDTSKLNNGVYHFKVTSKGEIIATGKLVVTK